MALGVLNNLSAIYAENNLNNTSNSLQTVLQQLSSGSRINSGADDAAGLSLINGLQANSTALTQSATNSTEGVGLLKVADGALSQVTNLLNRAITLATEASNGTLNTSQGSAANQEYQSILAEINNIGSTTTYNQQAVFGGKTVSIYTGDASPTGSSIDNLYIRSLSSSSVGDTGGAMSYSNGQNNVFIDLSKSGTNASVSDSLNGGSSGSTTITVNYLAKGTNGTSSNATANITVGAGSNYANTAQGLIDAINNSGLGLSATFATASQAGSVAVAAAQAANASGSGATDTGIEISGIGIGTGTNGAGEIGTLTINTPSDILGGTLTVVGADGKSHNITLGTVNSTDTLANLAATLNAAGFGVTATTNTVPVGAHAIGTVLTFTSDTAAVTVSGTSLTDNLNATTLTGTPAPYVPFNSTIGTVAISGTGTSGDILTAGTTLKLGANTITIAAGNNDTLATLMNQINSGTYGVTASLDSTGKIMSLTSSNPAMTVGGTLTDSNAAATFAVTNASSTYASSYYSVGITGSILDTSTTGGTANIGMVADNNGTTSIATMNYTDGAGANLSATDLSTQVHAQAALTQLNLAITDVAAMDGYIGAQINTLNSVSQVLNTQQQNVVAAQNAIQATDYASATSNMSKYEILSQTGIAALAQANTVQQEVTKLLQ